MIKIGLFEQLSRRVKAIFNSNYRKIDTTNRIYNGKPYHPNSQQFFVQARVLQEKEGITQTEAVDIIKAIYQVKGIVRKQKDERTKKDIKRVEMILETYVDDELESGIEVVNEFGTP